MNNGMSGTGLLIPPYQFNMGMGGNDLSSLSNYSTQGASLFGNTPGGLGQGVLPGQGGLGLNASGFGASGGGGGIFGQLGANIPTIQLGLGILSSLGGLYGAGQANRLARDSFNFQKGVTNTNLNNQIKSYNTALEDRSRSRAVQENRSEQSAQDYIDRNRLTR